MTTIIGDGRYMARWGMLTLVTIVSLTYVSVGENSRGDHLAKGDEHYRAFDNEQARVEYELAFVKDSVDYQTLLRLVRVYNDIGRLHLRKNRDAEIYYTKAVEFAKLLQRYFPDSATTHFWLALSYGSLIPFRGVSEKIHIGKDVRKHARKAIEIDSTFSLPYVILAIFEREGSQLSWFEKTIVRVVFGEDLSGSLEASEALLRKALKLDQRNSYAHYELGWTYKTMNDHTRSAEAFRNVLHYVPTSAREELQREEAKRQLDLLQQRTD
jgi:tetratricopeptide (TPR) repeat protein